MEIELVDSHCHLDRFLKSGELEGVLERAQAVGVVQLIAVGTSSEDWEVYRKMSVGHPGFIYYTVGLHPCHVDEDWESQVQQVMPFFTEKCLPVAIGEIGLDYFHLPKEEEKIAQLKAWQAEAFRRQLELALQLDAPIVVHSRHAFEDSVRMIDESGVDWRKVVFHCFPGGVEEVKILNKRGGRASFTGIVTYKNAPEVRDSVKEQGASLVMIETDAPYLAPDPYRGKQNEPAYVKHVARKCAEVLDMSLEDFAKQATANTRAFFGL